MGHILYNAHIQSSTLEHGRVHRCWGDAAATLQKRGGGGAAAKKELRGLVSRGHEKEQEEGFIRGALAAHL